MKILHVVRNFSPPTETFIYDLVCGLEKEGSVKNEILCYKKRTLINERPFKLVQDSSAIEKKWLSFLEKVLSLFKTKLMQQRALERYLQHNAPDIIHCHFAWTLWDYMYPTLKNIHKKIPIIISTHGTDITRDPFRRDNQLILKELAQAENIYFTATTPFMMGLLEQLDVPSKKIDLVPNAVNPMFFYGRKQQYFKAGKILKIVTNARLVRWKGHEYLLEAFARLINEVVESAELTLIGDGVLREQLEKRARELGIANKVRFLGNIPHDTIPAILAENDLYIQPSIVDEATGQQEAFGISIVEAIAVGLPVIVTDTGGMPHVIGQQNVFAHVVPQKNSEALFKKIGDLLKSGNAFKSNLDYATERVAYYSQASQREACLSLYRKALSVS